MVKPSLEDSGRTKLVASDRRLALRRARSWNGVSSEREIHAELLRALLSIRGKHIEDVYPPSSQE